MGKLSDVVIATKEIEVAPGSSFSVRGINLFDIQRLLVDHAPAMKDLFEQAVQMRQSGTPFTPETIKGLLVGALKQFPDMIVAAIAYAADEPEAVDQVKRLPVVAQLEALQSMIVLSIESDAQLKKLMEIVIQMIEGFATGMTSLNQPSIVGFGASANA
jgi:hypothetical protein